MVALSGVTLQQDGQRSHNAHPTPIEGVDHLECAIRLPPFLGSASNRASGGIRRPGGSGESLLTSLRNIASLHDEGPRSRPGRRTPDGSYQDS